MKTNKQSKIVVPKSGFRRSRFNWSHDVNTTYSWGEIQPTQCKLLVPNSKTTFDAQSLIRLAPMVAPTFGRVKYKTYNQFVSLAEIMPNFDAMMAQEPVSTASGTKVPTELPSLLLGQLSSWCFMGARATLYFASAGTYNGQSKTAAEMAALGLYETWYRTSPNDNSSAGYTSWNAHASHVFGSSSTPIYVGGDVFNNSSNGVLPAVTAVRLNLSKFGSVYTGCFPSGDYHICLGAKSKSDLCPVVRSFTAPDVTYPDYCHEVTMESADYVLEGSYNWDSSDPTKVEYFALALELSDFGKRLRKVFQGCGYQVNLTSSARVSILPLLATYKAYFDIFGLELYQGWETTFCSRMLKYIENNFVGNVGSMCTLSSAGALSTIDNSNIGVAFILMEVANMWYTDDVDYVSAHLSKLGVSPLADLTGFINLNSAGNVSAYGIGVAPTVSDQVAAADGTTASQNETGNSTVGSGEVGGLLSTLYTHHTELDAEMLKRMYRWTNRNTILGRRIAELLRAQGLGKYVDECKSNYIGSTDTMVTISDVVSTAATSDASLGEYGGKGLQYVNDKTLVFENDSYGYWITLCTVVPESGYTQGLDPTLTSLTKMELYNADFDAIGMEATPKWNVLHTNYIVGDNDNGAATFGFIPRYSRFKVTGNLVNGDFNRHNMRNVYLPYTLDKQLNVNDFGVAVSDYDEGTKLGVVKLDKSVRVGNMPIAGNVWRYPTKYNWLGNFDRIFLRVGLRDDSDIGSATGNDAVGWSDYNPDNFLSHSIYNVQCYAPMKSIEDSYGLEEDQNPTAGVQVVTKA